MNRVRLLADPVNTPGPLDQTNDRPGQIEIDHNRAILKVLPFGEHIGCDQDVQFAFAPGKRLFFVGFRAEPPGQPGGVFRTARNRRDSIDPGPRKGAFQISGRIRELSENQNFVVCMLRSQQPCQGFELVIPRRMPVAAD